MLLFTEALVVTYNPRNQDLTIKSPNSSNLLIETSPKNNDSKDHKDKVVGSMEDIGFGICQQNAVYVNKDSPVLSV